MCATGEVAFVFGLFVTLMTVTTFCFAVFWRKLEREDLLAVKRNASKGGKRAWKYRALYPLLLLIYLPGQGFWRGMVIGVLFMLPIIWSC